MSDLIDGVFTSREIKLAETVRLSPAQRREAVEMALIRHSHEAEADGDHDLAVGLRILAAWLEVARREEQRVRLRRGWRDDWRQWLGDLIREGNWR